MRSPLHCKSLRRGSRGFTLVELLVVVLILAVLMAVALPLYLSAVADAQLKTCRSNMQTIANAVQSTYVHNGYSNYGTIITACSSSITTATLTDLTALPVCPNGGTYSLANGSSGSNTTFKVSCTTTSPYTHGTFQPGYDHN